MSKMKKVPDKLSIIHSSNKDQLNKIHSKNYHCSSHSSKDIANKYLHQNNTLQHKKYNKRKNYRQHTEKDNQYNFQKINIFNSHSLYNIVQHYRPNKKMDIVSTQKLLKGNIQPCNLYSLRKIDTLNNEKYTQCMSQKSNKNQHDTNNSQLSLRILSNLLFLNTSHTNYQS